MQLKLPKDGRRTIYVPVPLLLLSRIGLEFVWQGMAGAKWHDEYLARDLADLVSALATPADPVQPAHRLQPVSGKL